MSEARAQSSAPQAAPHAATCARAFEEELDYVYRSLRRLGVAPADAEDLAQDVFLVMWRRWADYQADRPLRPWLAGIALHVAQRHGRRRQREIPGADVDAPDDRAPLEDQLAADHARRLV